MDGENDGGISAASPSGSVVLITAANGCLGQQVVKHLLDHYSDKLLEIRTLDSEKPFTNILDYSLESYSIPLRSFVGNVLTDGSQLLTSVLDGVDTVLHLDELQDFALIPNKEALWSHNYHSTEALLKVCRRQDSVRRFVYLSSIYVSVSAKWPAANKPEIAKEVPAAEWPFPDYCSIKQATEQLILHDDGNSKLRRFVVRTPDIFGEGDTSSPVAQLLRVAQQRAPSPLPVFGDRQGVLQLVYSGNVAYGLVKVLQKMDADATADREVVFIVDDTPKKDVYAVALPLLPAIGCRPSDYRLPFFPLYLPYRLFELMVHMVHGVLGAATPSWLCQLPSANYIYTVFYHWVFVSGVKARIYLDYIPLYSFNAAIEATVKALRTNRKSHGAATTK